MCLCASVHVCVLLLCHILCHNGHPLHPPFSLKTIATLACFNPSCDVLFLQKAKVDKTRLTPVTIRSPYCLPWTPHVHVCFHCLCA
ncbi:MAG: hypothetical protein J3R72DRAFT_455984 [Linnemannia gamsii]|nr:MAG: hypothetical protein J3R72DRAFT_455984 [Linnemannia gamsii]